MFDCRVCGHSEMAHVNYAGCCVVAGCPCTGIDGHEGRCLRENHATDCNQLTERPRPVLDTKLARVLWRKGQSTLAAEVKARIVEMKGEGHGKRVIARALGLHPAVVQAYLQDVFGVGPASTPQMRAHQHPEVAPAASAFAEQWERELTARQGS